MNEFNLYDTIRHHQMISAIHKIHVNWQGDALPGTRQIFGKIAANPISKVWAKPSIVRRCLAAILVMVRGW